jgi:hypothetical protein
VSDQKPITYQFLIERWADGLKVLGAGNGAGLLASGASLQFLSAKPGLLTSIKVGAGFFLVGILSFAVAFLLLTILPLTIQHFIASSDKIYKEFKVMITDLMATNKADGRAYVALVLTSMFSFVCFMVGSSYIVVNVISFF